MERCKNSSLPPNFESRSRNIPFQVYLSTFPAKVVFLFCFFYGHVLVSSFLRASPGLPDVLTLAQATEEPH